MAVVDFVWNAVHLLELPGTYQMTFVDPGAAYLLLGSMLAVTSTTGDSRGSRVLRILGIVLVSTALIASALMILEWATGTEFHHGVMLFLGILARDTFVAPQLSLPLALSFLVLSVAILLQLTTSHVHVVIRDYLVLVALGTAGGAFAVEMMRSWRIGNSSTATWPVRALVVLLVSGMVALTRGNLAQWLKRDSITTRLLKPLLLATIVAPLLADEIIKYGARLGHYNDVTASTLHTLAITVVLSVITIVSGVVVGHSERKREDAVSRLRQRESLLKLQFAQSPVACMVRDRDFNVLSWNPASTAIFGYSEDEMIGRSSDLLVPAKELESILPFRERLLSGESFPPRVRTSVNKHGTSLICRWSHTPLLSDGSVVAVLTMVEDLTEMARTEANLLESEERYRILVEQAPYGFLVRAGETVLYANAMAARILGTEAKALIGRSVLDFVHPGCLELTRERMNRLDMEQECLHPVEHLWVRTDGSKLEIQISGAPIVWNGIRAAQVVFSDVTEAHAAQRALKASEERCRRVIESTNEGVLVLDTEGRIELANQQMCHMLGRSAAEMLGKPAPALMAKGESLEEVERRVRNRRQGVSERYETRLMRNSEEFWARISAAPLEVNGEFAGSVALIEDIDKQRADENRLRTLLRAVDQVEEVIFTTTVDGEITYVNSAFEKVYGYTREEALGRTPRLLKSGDRSIADYERFWAELLSGRSVRIEWVNRHKNGALRDIVASTTPVVGDDGAISGFISVQRDVTDEHRALEERMQFDRQLTHLGKMEALGTLAGGIAHDFNNILAVILTHSSVVERLQSDDRAAASLQTIKQAVRRGAAISRQILTFARRTELDVKPVGIGQIAMEIGSMISETFPKAIHLSVDVQSDLPLINADAAQVHQTLLNLCLNARDAMPDGGSLRISTKSASRDAVQRLFPDAPPRQHVCVTVGDTGIGMDAGTRSRMFEPFFTTKGPSTGTGLGLALVYGVVKSHGASIDVVSEPGQGTEFRLYFPAAESIVSDEPEAAAESVPLRGSETVLVVDDEPDILGFIADFLREGGYRVVAAAGAQEAIEHCRRLAGELSVVITDLGLPRMSTSDYVTSLRLVAPNVPMIAMTGYVDPDIHLMVRSAGVRDILQKPFGPEELQIRLRAALDSPPRVSRAPGTA